MVIPVHTNAVPAIHASETDILIVAFDFFRLTSLKDGAGIPSACGLSNHFHTPYSPLGLFCSSIHCQYPASPVLLPFQFGGFDTGLKLGKVSRLFGRVFNL